MTTAIKRRRGTTTQHSTFTGLEGEITVDTTKDTLVVHDGSTAGGFPLLREDLSNNTNVASTSTTQTFTNKTINLSSNTLTGTTAQFNTALSDGDFATLAGTETLSNKTFSTNPTISSGTANGVAYLNGSKVLTTGSALTFDGSNLGINCSSPVPFRIQQIGSNDTGIEFQRMSSTNAALLSYNRAGASWTDLSLYGSNFLWLNNGSEQMRLTSTGLGIGTSSPTTKLTVSSATQDSARFLSGNKVIDSTGNIQVFTTNAQAANIGGSIALGGNNGSAGSYDPWSFATIKGAKENSTSGDFAGYFAIGTAAGGGSITERMRLDSSGNLGLGVTPSAWVSSWKAVEVGALGAAVAGATANGSLHLLGNTINGSGGYVYAANGYAVRYAIAANAGSHAWFTAPSGTAGNAISFTQAMTLDASGNLGVGTSSPATKLNLYGTSTQELRISTNTSGDVRFGADLQGAYYNWIDNYRSSGAMAFGTNNTERMRIDSSGNVGIGTSSPASLLDVAYNGSAVATIRSLATTGTRGAKLRLNVPSSGGDDPAGQIEFTYNTDYTVAGSIVVTSTPNTMKFSTGSTERMRIDSSGNLLVGTTSSTANVTASDNTAGNAYYIAAGIGSTVGLASTAKNDYALQLNRQGNTDGVIAGFRRNGTLVGNISVTGSATAYNTSSDYRLKENVQPMQNALDVVQQLNPVTYTWKADGSDGQGFIAHELQAVVPDCVTGEKDAVDSEGNPVYQGIDTSFLVATLTKAIQELNEKVTQQAAEIAALKGA